MRTEIPIPIVRLDEFCRRWKIAELRVFGSALREDFRPDSDLDLLVTSRRMQTRACWITSRWKRNSPASSGVRSTWFPSAHRAQLKLDSAQGHPGERGAVLCLAMTRIFSTS